MFVRDSYTPFQSSPSSISSEENTPTSSSATPPPFYPNDLPPPYHSGYAPDCDNKPAAPSRLNIAHPYARLYAKKDGAKRRKIWNHALEKSLFTPNELSLMGAPSRRMIYMASLEAHVDRLHAQMIELGYFPIDFSQLEPFKGLNSKTAKSMVSGLQHDTSHTKLKLLELERSNDYLRKILASQQHPHPPAKDTRCYTLESTKSLPDDRYY